MTSRFRILVVIQLLLHCSLSATAEQTLHRRSMRQVFERQAAAPTFSSAPSAPTVSSSPTSTISPSNSPSASRSPSLSPSHAPSASMSPSTSSAPSSEPTDFPTESPTDTPTFSEDFFLQRCAEVASNYADSTCDCSLEEQNIVCELPGSQRFPFQYILFEYDDKTGKVVNGSECYCQNENNCGSNADDYCLSMQLIDTQNCAITFLADGAKCSNACQPCVDDVDLYGMNIDACFTGGTPNGCIAMDMTGKIGENHDRNLAPPEFIKACDDVIATYPDSTCKCFAEDQRMECSLANTTEFQNVYLSFLYDSNTTKINEGFKCFCTSEDCGQNAADYCLSVSLVGNPTCNVTLLQTNEQLVDCCDVCNSPEYYGVNTNGCYAEDQVGTSCFEIDIDKDSGENHALGTSAVPSSSIAPSSAPSLSARPSATPTGTPSHQPSAFPSISPMPTQSPTPSPTKAPVVGTPSPTLHPSGAPTMSLSPSNLPTGVPSASPSGIPSSSPSMGPTSQSLAQIVPPTAERLPTNAPSIEKSFELTPALPSLPPTTVPAPTNSPTQGPTVETQSTTIEANGDTYIYRSGIVSSQPTGTESTMLVQNGPATSPEIPDAYALISFELGTTSPLPSLTTSRATAFDVTGFDAQLCLQHVENNSPDAVTSILTICRVDVSQMEESFLDADSLTSSSAMFSMPEDCLGRETAMIDFEVSPDDAEVCIDVLQLLIQSSETSSRRLAPEDPEGVLFMIDSIYTEKPLGDLFYTKNSGARAPKMVINHPLSAPSSPPTLQPVVADPQSQSPTPGVTVLSGDKSQNSDSGKSNNGLYALFLLLLVIPIAWVVIRRRNIRREYENTGEQGSQYSYNHEDVEIATFDEEEISGLSSYPKQREMEEEEAASGLESFPGHPGMYFSDQKDDSIDGEIYEDDDSSVPESSAYASSVTSSDATGSCPW